MEKDFSKLLPALFNDKDLCFTELMENFFEEFDGTYCCNVQGTTLLVLLMIKKFVFML